MTNETRPLSHWQACLRFLAELRRDFLHTGAVLPSSRFLARAMTAHLHSPRPPLRILEAGPGTGAITTEILRRLQPGDQLDLVELNPNFVAFLGQRMETDTLFQRHRGQVHLLHGAVEQVPGEGCYDCIISGLPLNNFPRVAVRQVFLAFQRLAAPGATLTFFEYLFIRHLKWPFVDKKERQRLYRVGRLMARQVQTRQLESRPVLINVPPAFVRHLRLRDADSG